jgi:anti-sigma B factor antagonist
MSLEIAQREQEGIVIIDLKGHLTLGEGDLDFRSELSELVRSGKSHVVLNLNDVSEMDATGLGTLLFALAKLRKAGGGLALVNLKPWHIELLVETQLATVFEVFKTDQDAINSFFPDREVHRYDILEFVQSQQKLAESKSAVEPASPS